MAEYRRAREHHAGKSVLAHCAGFSVNGTYVRPKIGHW